MRVTAEGRLKVCLFGSEAWSLRDAFRGKFLDVRKKFYYCPAGMNDEEVIDLISSALKTKKAALGGHSNPEELASQKNRPMILIGG